MKTKLLLTAVWLLSFLPVVSQEYHPMLNNPSWILRDFVNCCRLPQTWTIPAPEDVVIDGTTYKKFINSSSATNYHSFIYLREDEDQRKVFSLVNGAEVVLYDFSLLQGDIYDGYNVAVDYVTINGVNRKKITLTRFDENYGINLTQVWIEGVGSPAHPFYPTINMYNALSSSGGRSVNLVCSFQNGQHVYGNSDCTIQRLDNNEFATTSASISFSPNPFQGEFVISAEVLLDNATFKLYNSQGRLVREVLNLSGYTQTINRGQLNSGLYFGQLYDQNGRLLKSSKMMAE